MDDKNISSLLEEYYLAFCFKLNYLYCIRCEVIVSKNFRRHVKEQHCKKILLPIVNRIKTLLQNNSTKILSLHYEKSSVDKEPLTGLKILHGFKCASCFYCCVSEETSRKHKCSSFTKFEKKNVQSFNYRQSKFYFSVFTSSIGANQKSSRVCTTVEMALTMIIDTKKGNALPIESNSGILKIYSMLGWYFTDDLLWK